MANTIKTSEANVSRAIRDFLDAKRVMWFRMNASAQLLSYTNKSGVTKRRMLRGHRPGTADLLALLPATPLITLGSGATPGAGPAPWEEPQTFTYYTTWVPRNSALWVEVKAPGKKQRPEQIEFQREVEEYGCFYLLADNVDVVMDWFKERGL